MLSAESVAKIKSLADEVSRREGCLLYDIEFSNHPKNRILRVFIDVEDAAVSVEQCANVSRGLSLLLDVEDLIPGDSYELEVSSPGIERPLKEPWHFKKSIGHDIKLTTFESIPELKGETKSLTGTLQECSDNAIIVLSQNVSLSVPFTNIKKAQVIFIDRKNEKKR